MAFSKAVPTSFGGAKNFVKGSGRTATWVAMAVIGLGLFAFASPFLQKIPILGGLVRGGQGMLPGKAAGMTVDQWGRVR
jgi:hypothetical protein